MPNGGITKIMHMNSLGVVFYNGLGFAMTSSLASYIFSTNESIN